MALYHKWDVKNGFAYVFTFFSLISDGLGGVTYILYQTINNVPCKQSRFDKAMLSKTLRVLLMMYI